MTNPICFNCGMPMIFGRTMEEQLDTRLPVFCSIQCSIEFPDNGTPEFEERLNKLRGSVIKRKE